MFKKAQLRFIAITLSIVLTLFAIFFGLAYLIFRKAYSDSILSELYVNEKEYFDGNTHFRPNVLIISFATKDFESDASQNYIIVTGKTNYSQELIAKIIETAFTYNDGTGSIGDVFYLVSTKGEETIVVACSMADKIEQMRYNILITLTIMLVMFLVVAIVTVISSYGIIKPLKENFYKQQQFVSDASHELRTPVAIISANADVLKNVMGENDYLSNIKSQSKRLEYLVSDMLTLAKSSEKKPAEKENFSLSEEVIGMVLPYEALLFENGKTLVTEIEENLTYFGDRESFKTILSILMDNSVKHSAVNATIKVSLKRENGKVVLSVFNTGSLIPDDLSEKVFERFYRADGSRARSSGGSGLGLAIAKTVADVNRWKIHAKSKFGESMTIILII